VRQKTFKCNIFLGYNQDVDTPKVPKSQFDAVLRSLLNAAPMPMAGIPRKREAKPSKPQAKKRG
jgi:hypothetical protein